MGHESSLKAGRGTLNNGKVKGSKKTYLNSAIMRIRTLNDVNVLNTITFPRPRFLRNFLSRKYPTNPSTKPYKRPRIMPIISVNPKLTSTGIS